MRELSVSQVSSSARRPWTTYLRGRQEMTPVCEASLERWRVALEGRRNARTKRSRLRSGRGVRGTDGPEVARAEEEPRRDLGRRRVGALRRRLHGHRGDGEVRGAAGGERAVPAARAGLDRPRRRARLRGISASRRRRDPSAACPRGDRTGRARRLAWRRRRARPSSKTQSPRGPASTRRTRASRPEAPRRRSRPAAPRPRTPRPCRLRRTRDAIPL